MFAVIPPPHVQLSVLLCACRARGRTSSQAADSPGRPVLQPVISTRPPLPINQSCPMDSVAVKQRMPSTSKANAVSANAVYQQSRKSKLSSEYHESQSPSRRSVPSQMQRHNSASASSSRHQESLKAMYRPKAAPPPLHAMQATRPLPSHTAPAPKPRSSPPRPRTLMLSPSHRACPPGARLRGARTRSQAGRCSQCRSPRRLHRSHGAAARAQCQPYSGDLYRLAPV